jgi:hypothetical protein
MMAEKMPMIGQGAGGIRRIARAALALLPALAASCGGGDGNGVAADEAVSAGAAEGDLPVMSENEQAALADEAAADEAADLDAFGGNAAAGETGNAFVGGGGAAVPGEANGVR